MELTQQEKDLIRCSLTLEIQSLTLEIQCEKCSVREDCENDNLQSVEQSIIEKLQLK